LGRSCREQVRDVLAAVVARDIGQARRVAARDDRIDCVYHRIFDDLIQLMTTDALAVYPEAAAITRPRWWTDARRLGGRPMRMSPRRMARATSMPSISR
jgi:hypothetical protein